MRGFFRQLETKKYKVHVRVFLSRYRGYTECPDCRGARLRQEALNVRVGGRNLGDVSRMNIAEARTFFDALEFTPEEEAIAGKVLVEIRQRLKFLNDVGLDYLTLDRLSATLSGGEAQRIQLATCLGSRLVGACYVLDEPSIGLHSRDTARLIRILEELRDLGNTIVVVEHDADIMRAADHIVDLGPGAGEHGGRIIFEGSFGSSTADGAGSLTGRYLRGEAHVSRRATRRPVNPKRVVKFLGARAHNLKNIDVEIPLDMMVAVTGVSGSGKSTLVHDVIYASLARRPPDAGREPEDLPAVSEKQTCRRVERAELLTAAWSWWTSRPSAARRAPIPSPTSRPSTSSATCSPRTPEADRRGYTAGHFSFNIPGGRCETCQGDGTVTVEMQFLADVELVCEECKGTRYKSSVLDVRYRGLNIHEVLQLTVKEALAFFADVPRLCAKLRVLAEVGLGYLRLGQSATTLSGGEAQRVKLAAHLAEARPARTRSSSSTSPPPACTSTTSRSCSMPSEADPERRQRADHRAQPGSGPERRLDHRPRPRRRRARRPHRGQGTPEQIADAAGSYTGRYLQLITN